MMTPTRGVGRRENEIIECAAVESARDEKWSGFAMHNLWSSTSVDHGDKVWQFFTTDVQGTSPDYVVALETTSTWYKVLDVYIPLLRSDQQSAGTTRVPTLNLLVEWRICVGRNGALSSFSFLCQHLLSVVLFAVPSSWLFSDSSDYLLLLRSADIPSCYSSFQPFGHLSMAHTWITATATATATANGEWAKQQ